MSGTRGCEAYHRSNSDFCVSVGWAAGAAVWPLAAAASVDASRGKNARVVAAPAKNRSVSVSASGLVTKSRASRDARRGNVVMGKDVAAPDTRNSPMTAAYVVRQSTQTVFSSTKDA